METLKNPKGEEQTKTVLHFRETKKLLPLNQTNWDAVASLCGGDSDDWPGHQIELYPTTTPMGGKLVDCVHIRAPAQSELPRPKAAAKKTAKPVLHADDDMDDEIPMLRKKAS